MTQGKETQRATAAGRRWTREAGLAAVRDWRASGLSAAAFCRSRQLPPHRLRYWSQRTADEASEAEPSSSGERFFELCVPAIGETKSVPSALSGDEPSVTIHLGDHVAMRVALTMGRARFVEAIQWVLEAARA